MEKINIAIADDQTLFRESLVELVQSNQLFNLVLAADNGKNFLLALQNATVLPHIALIDMAMPEMNGIELTCILKQQYPDIKIIIVSVYNQERYIYKMISSGASGYLVKTCGKAELLDAIQAVHNTGFYMNGEALKAIQNAAKHAGRAIKTINNIAVELTTREKEILQMICKEYSNPEIAEKLFLSVRTVEGHRNNLLLKTGCHNTAGLVLFAVRNQIYDAGL